MKKIIIAALIIGANSLGAEIATPVGDIDWNTPSNAAPMVVGETTPLGKTGWREDFNSFEGTYASLPKSMMVSNDGTNLMSASDSDFRGINDGDLSTGGCYAWEVGTNDFALGYQPTTSEFTPGFFEVCFSNSSDITYRFIKVEYDFVVLNNENRSSKLQLQFHLMDGRIGGLSTATTEEAEDKPAEWNSIRAACRVQPPEPIAPGEVFKLRWYGDDSSGSGARDEHGIDNIYVLGIRTIGTVIVVR